MALNQNQTTIAIIGGGEIGSALEFTLSKKNIILNIWDRDPKKCKTTISLSETVHDSQIIFLCVPSWVNREVTKKIYENIKDNHKKIVITLSKGIEETSLKTMPLVLKEELKNKSDYGVLVGPMIAEEIKSDQPAAGVIGISNTKWQPEIKELFRGTNLKIGFSDDIHGLAICSVLKNIYSLAFGIIDALGFGINVKSYITVEAHQEMKIIVKMLGGKKKTSEGLAGLGDLLATGWSNFSHNFTTGRNIILKKEKNPHSEGCISLSAISNMLGNECKNFNIFYSVKKIILDKKDAQKTITEIFKND